MFPEFGNGVREKRSRWRYCCKGRQDHTFSKGKIAFKITAFRSLFSADIMKAKDYCLSELPRQERNLIVGWIPRGEGAVVGVRTRTVRSHDASRCCGLSMEGPNALSPYMHDGALAQVLDCILVCGHPYQSRLTPARAVIGTR